MGSGALSFTATAQPVAGDIVFRYIDAGGYHACGITTTEQLLCWGYNADGQLGLGSTSQVTSPTLIPGDFRYRRIAGGFYHTCAYTLAANAFCWGNNSEGRLGSGTGSSTSPVQVMTAASIDTLLGDTVVVGSTALLVRASPPEKRTRARSTWCRRRGAGGAIRKVSSARGFHLPFGPPHQHRPVQGGERRRPSHVRDHGGWRGPLLGVQRGRPARRRSAAASSPVPVAVPSVTFRTDPLVIFHSPDPDFPLPPGPFVAAGYDHTCAITGVGTNRVLGAQRNGQVGDGTTANRSVARHRRWRACVRGRSQRAFGIAARWTRPVRPGAGETTRRASWATAPIRRATLRSPWPAGSNSSTSRPESYPPAAVTPTGVAYCWGDNEYGQLGDGQHRVSSAVPVKVAFQP